MSEPMNEEKQKSPAPAEAGTGPGCLGKLLAALLILAAAAVAALALTSLRYIKPWEVGLRYNTIIIPRLMESGKPKILEPGYNIVIPFLHEFTKYDCSVQQFEMAPEFPGMPKPDLEPLKVRTARDQDEIEVYVTILYQVDRDAVASLRPVYPDNLAIKQKGIAKHCPDILQNYLGRIQTAQQFYSMTPQKRKEILEKRKADPDYLKNLYPTDEDLLDRFTQAEKARAAMNKVFLDQGGGIHVIKILIWDFKFKDEIEASIISKVIADEKVKLEAALKQAAAEMAKWQKAEAEAEAAAVAELAKGVAEARKIDGEAEKYQIEKIALGNRLILEAQAEGKGLINAALAGPGGKTYVGLEYAKALQGIELIVLPAGSEKGLNPLDLKQAVEKSVPGKGVE